jgi:5-methylcytosine-specific restriction protein B
MPDAGTRTFTANDCVVFGRTRAGSPWTDLDGSDQGHFRSIRARLKELAQQLVQPAALMAVPLVSFVSTLNPSGRVPREIWSCVFPEAVGNKSYALQFAVIINGAGAEICCCLGAGTSQTSAPEAMRDYQGAWQQLLRRLADVPLTTLQLVESGLGKRWQLRKSWLLEPGRQDFASLREWLIFATSAGGAGASISRNLTPQELEEAGDSLLDELQHDFEAFAPLFVHAYGHSAEATVATPSLAIADRAGLHPLLLDDLQRMHAEMLANRELRSRDALAGYYNVFRQRFGPDVLLAHEGEALLSLIHETGRDGLIYWLEFKDDEEFPSLFGSIAGGSALKYGFYRRQETGEWMTGHPQSQRALTTAEAITLARRDRDQLVAAADLVSRLSENADVTAYVALQEALNQAAPDVQGTSWGHKYLSLLFPNKVDDFHAVAYQRYHLIKLLQVPSAVEGRYVNAPLFTALTQALDWPMNHLATVLNRRNGSPHRYWRIGTRAGDTGESQWERMQRDSLVAIGWKNLGDLSPALAGDNFKETLRQAYATLYPNDVRAVGRQVQQIAHFCQTIQDRDYVIASDGATVLGIGRISGPYVYSSAERFPHARPVEWLDLGEWPLPMAEGLRTTVFEYRRRPDNLVAIERRVLEAQPPQVPPPTTKVVSGTEGGSTRRATWTGGGKVGRIQDLLDRKGQAILYGPPGTGKTYWAEQAVAVLAALWNYGVVFEQLSPDQQDHVAGHRTDAFVRACTFHPSYSYEDFIEGYRPTTVGGTLQFSIRDGIFKTLCKVAAADPDSRYYLIIDEINRGDIPRIFGELLTLLDMPKRGSSVVLPLSGERFGVPKNVLVIGTMNTADRSIALLDTALRRRFGFVELMPDPATLGDTVIEGIALRPWLASLNERITAHVGRDGRNLQIGHSYLMSRGRPIHEFGHFARVLQEDVLPLLEEYCYEDWDTLERILGPGLVDVAKRRFKAELFEPGRRLELVQAVLAVTPDVSASATAVAADATGGSDTAELDDDRDDEDG